MSGKKMQRTNILTGLYTITQEVSKSNRYSNLDNSMTKETAIEEQEFLHNPGYSIHEYQKKIEKLHVPLGSLHVRLL